MRSPSSNPASYRVIIDEKRLQTLETGNIVIDPGQDRHIELNLRPEPARPAGSEMSTPEVARESAPPPTDEGGSATTTVPFTSRWDAAPQVDLHPSPFPLLTTAPGVQGNGAAPIVSGISARNGQSWLIDGLPVDTTSQTANPQFVEMVQVDGAGTNLAAARPVSIGMITRRGGEGFHGSAYVRRGSSALDARPYFDAAKTSYRVREAAGEVGGPIIAGRTYFSAGVMYQKLPYAQWLYADVPTDKMRTGDFSQFLDPTIAPNGKTVVVYDPRSGTPFPGNIMPTSRYAKVSFNYLTYFPSYNTGTANTMAQNYSWLNQYGPDTYSGNWPFGRVDQKISKSNQLYVRWLQNQTASVAQGSLGTQLDSTQTTRYRSLVLSDMHSFSGTVVNHLSVSRSTLRVLQGETEGKVEPAAGDTFISALALEGVNPTAVSKMGFPAVAVSGLTGPAMQYGGGYNDNVASKNNVTTFEDSVTWIRGKHNFRAGGQYMHANWLDGAVPQTIYGAFSFSGTFTGLGFADFLLGLPATSTRSTFKPNRQLHQNQGALFLGDTFRVNQRLTLDYGVRWDYYGSPVYNDGYMANWDPQTGQVIVAPGTLTSVSTYYPKSITVAVGQVVPKVKMTNFRPRLGAAYRLNESTVLRGGYSEYTEGEGYGADGTLNPTNVWNLTETYTNTISKGVTALTFPKPFPSAGSALLASQSVTALPSRNDEGIIRQYNATLERTIKAMTVSAAFVGARGVGMNYTVDTNKPAASTIAFTNSRKPFPQFANTYQVRTDGDWHYDSMVLAARRRTGQFTWDTSFTWANNISNYANTVDPYNVTSHWTRDGADRRAYFVASGTWAVPVGRGHRLFGQASPLVDRFIGNWSLQAIATMASGQYYSPWFTGPDPANASAGYVTQLPDCTGNPNTGARTINQWFNPAAFTVPSASAGRYGSCGMNILEGYPTHVAHASLSKMFAVREYLRVGIVARVSNVTNTPNFTFPSSNISNANPGVFTAASQVAASSLERQGLPAGGFEAEGGVVGFGLLSKLKHALPLDFEGALGGHQKRRRVHFLELRAHETVLQRIGHRAIEDGLGGDPAKPDIRAEFGRL